MSLDTAIESNYPTLYALCSEIRQRAQFVALIEKNPVQAVLEKQSHLPLKNQLLDFSGRIEHLDPRDLRTKSIQALWQKCLQEQSASRFLESLENISDLAKRSAEIVPLPNGSPFAQTDLVLFKEDYKGALPPNGLLESEYAAIERIYKDIESGNAPIAVNGSEQNQAILLSHIAKLLTREPGRVLLYNLLSDKTKFISLSLGGQSEAERVGANSYELSLENRIVPYFAKWPDGTIKSEMKPPWIILAHELIHIRHYIKEERVNGADHLLDPSFTDPEEQRTILGIYGDLPYDPMNENVFLQAFGFHPRCAHKALDEEGLLVDQLFSAIRVKAIADVKELALSCESFEDLSEALSDAIRCHQFESVKILYEAYRNIQHKQNLPDEPGLLSFAAREGSAEILAWLMSQPENQDEPDSDGRVLLHHAVHDEEMAAFLLQRGFEPEPKDDEGKTPLELLAANTRLEAEKKCRILELFLHRGAKTIPKELFLAAVQCKKWPLVKRLEALGIGTLAKRQLTTPKQLARLHCSHLCDNDLRLALFEALFSPRHLYDILQEFNKRNLSFDFHNHDGKTPLTIAAESCSDDIVQSLVESGADPSLPDAASNTPLHIAAASAQTNKVAILLKARANFRAKNSKGELPCQCIPLKCAAEKDLMDRFAEYALHRNDLFSLRQAYPRLFFEGGKEQYLAAYDHFVTKNSTHPHLRSWFQIALQEAAQKEGLDLIS